MNFFLLIWFKFHR